MEIRNIAIIAHVDHGKTTLVDGILKQTHTFRANEAEMNQELIMDSNVLEREKGITILAKNTAVFYKGTKINIIDTPGHADFGGEVERVLNMADGALLIVDAAEGPLPQTRFVLQQALKSKLKIILVINKIDKRDARLEEVLSQTEDLFLSLADDPEHLDFIVLYAVGRDGKVFYKLPDNYTTETKGDLTPLFETILEKIPPVNDTLNESFQMLISTLDYDSYLGKLCIGRVKRGLLSVGQKVSLVTPEKVIGTYTIEKLYTSEGIKRKEIQTAPCGDIIAIAGIPQMSIGQTVTEPTHPEALPPIIISEPTLKITIGTNTSPFSGREGKYTTSRQIYERLMKEKETNLGLRIESDVTGSCFTVAGRGELHLTILLETMRREGYEMQVLKPQVLFKEVNGIMMEPFEEVTIDVPDTFVGIVTNEMGARKGVMTDMVNKNNGSIRLTYKISERNLLGVRNNLLTQTRGMAIFNSFFAGYEPMGPDLGRIRNGVIISNRTGKAVGYGLETAQNRGSLFIGPGVMVYEGMIVGLNSREDNIVVNVCKEKKLTNMHTENSDVAVQLTPPVILSLEQALDFIADDELLEITPKSLRLRKQYLSEAERRRVERGLSSKVG